jgi:hypothetical protein
MLEISHIDPTPDAHTFHAVHPRGVSFNALIGLVASWLGVPLCPFPQWFSKLSKEHKAQAGLKGPRADNPVLRIFSYYESATIGPWRESIGTARLDASRAVRVSKVLTEDPRRRGGAEMIGCLDIERLPPSKTEEARSVSVERGSEVRTGAAIVWLALVYPDTSSIVRHHSKGPCSRVGFWWSSLSLSVLCKQIFI